MNKMKDTATDNYFAIEANVNNVSARIECKQHGIYCPAPLLYSKDKVEWKEIPKKGTSIKIKKGEKCYFKNNDVDFDKIRFFMNNSVNLSGNIMSLIDKTCQSLEIKNAGQFYDTFSYNSSIHSIEGLLLPATTLSDECYHNMFNECNNLNYDNIVLPALHVPKFAYRKMFCRCEKIQKSADILATSVSSYSMESMYEDCCKLKEASPLYAEHAAPYCYNYMYKNTGLEVAPPIMLKNTAIDCCNLMFYNCFNLRVASDLHMRDIEDGALYMMYFGCKKLEKCATFTSEEIRIVGKFGMTEMYRFTSLDKITLPLVWILMNRAYCNREEYDCRIQSIADDGVPIYIDGKKIV